MRLLWVIPLGAASATAANAVFYYLVTAGFGEEFLFPNQFPPPDLAAMPVNDVIIFSVIFSLGAGIVFAQVSNLARKPIRIYLVIAIVTLFLSFAVPLSISSPPVAMSHKLVLVALHVLGAMGVVGTLVALGRGNNRGNPGQADAELRA
ncbi:MAG: hypothetical protein C1O27_001647 [Chloroflexi bacterium]|jgi:uncharacterized membrane protein (DUF4010 family)|nr:MAG: hypothetical protein C1O27_001647 [Chloroflexota bacterium]